MPSFIALRRAKELGYSLTTMLVKAYLDEHGPTPVGQVARACDVSVRSVERSIVWLKEKGLFSSSKTTSMSHDHGLHGSLDIRTATELTAPTAVPDGLDPALAADPLAQALLAEEILPWCVGALLAKVDRAVLERQLAFHRHRLESGFRFKGHPARYLFRACLNDYQPPADFHAVAHRRREQPEASLQAAPAAPTPVATAQPEMTRDGALTVIRLGLKSRMPQLREQALRLAAEWNIDPVKVS